jgi:hypothetical protein
MTSISLRCDGMCLLSTGQSYRRSRITHHKKYMNMFIYKHYTKVTHSKLNFRSLGTLQRLNFF